MRVALWWSGGWISTTVMGTAKIKSTLYGRLGERGNDVSAITTASVHNRQARGAVEIQRALEKVNVGSGVMASKRRRGAQKEIGQTGWRKNKSMQG